MRSNAGIRMGRASDAVLEQLRRDAGSAEVTYDHVGSTIARAGDTWRLGSADGGRFRAEGVVTLGVGSVAGGGDAVFEAARAGLQSWVCHSGIRARVFPHDTPVSVGETVLVALPAGPAQIVVANRIVRVIDEPDCFGFAYGTLPLHQESGEESFIVERRSNVTFTIRADAMTVGLAAHLTPVVRRVQRVAIGRYLDALARHVADGVARGEAGESRR